VPACIEAQPLHRAPRASIGGEDLFCHFSNILDGNALEAGSQVEFVKVYDERRGKERAEQVRGFLCIS